MPSIILFLVAKKTYFQRFLALENASVSKLLKGCRMGRSDKVSLWYMFHYQSTLDFAFFILE